MKKIPVSRKEKTTVKKKPAPPGKKRNSFPIVAIGASAGGLEAIIQILKNLPSNTGMAFIYVQHLSPDHKSMLTEILSQVTQMKVQEIDDTDKIKPNNLFIIPHNKGIEISDGHLKLIPREEKSSSVSIDVFFSSLAKAHKERVIGIVLSGSGSDGTKGLRDIKTEGGVTFAQDDSSKFTGMPHAAVAAGAIDLILSPDEIALELVRISKHPFTISNLLKSEKEDFMNSSDPDLKSILIHLLKTWRVDFSSYKVNTIKRRIMRRMLLYKLKTLKEYAVLLKEKSEESEMLYQDLLINVTAFFRESDTYRYLKTTLLPKLLKKKKQDEPLRIWIPACASGEEAYSIAMLLLEIQGNRDYRQIQIFATDLSNQSIGKARTGIYSNQELEGVSKKRLQNFFTKSNKGYRVNKELREMCAFAPHNILVDPPFSRLDFISCCNLFIYLDNIAQKSALATFYYALNEDGFLMLGKSETISSSPQLFSGVSKKFKIFLRKKNTGQRTLPHLSPKPAHYNAKEESPEMRTQLPFNFSPKKPKIDDSRNLDVAIDDMLVSEFMPACVVINKQLDVVQLRGSTDLYLKLPRGKATFNLIKMAQPEIAFELRDIVSQLIKTKSRVRKEGIEMKTNGGIKNICIEAIPLKIRWDESLYLIIFSEQQQIILPVESGKGSKGNSLAKDRRIKKLEAELAALHNNALAASQEYEVFSEELQSANEEIVSSNEELQTVNEELQTSKEELESANEELTTTNQELQVRNEQLNESYEYTEAISDTIYEPMVVLDKNFRIKSANNSFYKEFNLTEVESEGELLFDVGNKQWNIPQLRELLNDVLAKNSFFNDFEISHEFPRLGERVMLFNGRRLVQKSKSEQLILLAIQDVTDSRKKIAELKLKEKLEVVLKTKLEANILARKNMHSIFMKAPALICIFRGPDHVYELANDQYIQLIGYKDIIGKRARDVFPELEGTGFFELLDSVYKTGKAYAANETSVRFNKSKDKPEEVVLNFVYQPSHDESGSIDGIMVHAIDVTEQVALRKKIEKSEAKYRELISGLPVAVYTCNAEGYVELYNQAAVQLWGVEPHIGKDLWCGSWKIYRTDGTPLSLEECPMALSMKEGRSVSFEIIIERQDKTRRSVIPNPQIILDADGKVNGAINTLIDITPQVEAHKKVEEVAEQFNTLANNIQNLAWMANEDGWIYWYNNRWYEYTGTSPEDMEGWGWKSVHDPKILPEVIKKWQHSLSSGQPFEMVFPLKGADNVFRSFLTRVFPVRDDQGKIIRWIGTNTDISQQKEAEEQFRQMAERMPQKIWTSDAQGNRTYFNQVMIEYTGLNLDELKDWGWKKIIHPDDWLKTKQLLQHSIDTGDDYENENRLLRKDGIYLWHIVRATAVKDKNGNPLMWIGSNTEIHEQKSLSETLGENLKESNERLQTILQQAPDAVITLDQDGIIRNWNTEAETLFGWKEADAIGLTLTETIIPKRFRERHTAGIKHFLSTGEGQVINKPIELSALKKNGTEFPVELKISAIKRNNRYIFIGFIRDISLRKQAEEIIQNKTNQLMEAQQLAHIGSWAWDVRSNNIEWSDELYRIYGLTPQEFKADYESYLRYIHPDDKEYVNQIVQQAFKDHQPFRFFHKAAHADGNIRIISSTGKVFTDENGNVIKMTGTAQDVTEQKKYEEELKKSEERFYKIFDSNPVPMTLTDINTNKIKYANTLFYNSFGYSAKEVIGYTSEELHLIDPIEYRRVIKVIFEYLHENRSIEEVQALPADETEDLILKLKKRDEMKEFEIVYTRKNGEKFTALISFELIRLGTERYTVTSYRDITERKKIEEQLKNQNEQLESINKELQSFAYISSHDLQEPLRKIQTFATRILEKEENNLSEDGKFNFKRMQDAARRMQILITDLLAYSRTNTSERKFESTDLNTIIDEVKEELRESIEDKQAIIDVNVLCKVSIIPFQFRQLMLNLIGNSLKFSDPNDSPEIKIRCKIDEGMKFNNPRLVPQKKYCHISFTDNGIGFDQQYSEKIFEVFQRLHGKSEYNGTGIGLSIVKKIVENHNGIITATGELNKGASFDIYIPAT